MTREYPSLEELRERVQKGQHREIGNLLARRYARPTAVYGTWLAVRLGLSANQVTLTAFACSLAGSMAIGTGLPTGFIWGVILLHAAFWLDHVDGQVARWRKTASLDGVYFDYLMHHAAGSFLGFALGFGPGSQVQRLELDDCGIRDRAGMGLFESSQRLPLQGILSTSQEFNDFISGRRRKRRKTFSAHEAAHESFSTRRLARVQGL